MSELNRLTEALLARWTPEALIVYGSFAEGSQDAMSDFDALVITRRPAPIRDQSELFGRRLDLWFLTPEAAETIEPEDWPQLYHAAAAYDPRGIGAALIRRAREAIDALPAATPAQNRDDLDWLDRMLARAAEPTAEGRFRLLQLLTESAAIWCGLAGRHCFGPKKSLAMMRADDAAGAALYEAALRAVTPESAAAWVRHLREMEGTSHAGPAAEG